MIIAEYIIHQRKYYVNRKNVVFRNIKKLRSKLVKKLIFVELAGNLCYSNKLSERQILSLRQPAEGKDEK